MNMKPYRQGDVLIVPVQDFPSGLKQTKRVTLALGEVTGHHHTIERGAIGYAFDDNDLSDYFEVTENFAALTHQEHNPINIPKGKYRKIIQVEYTPGKIVPVRD